MKPAITSFAGQHDFLSNFFPAILHVRLADGTHALAPSVEHAFQMAKTLVLDEQREILFAHTPGEAKRMGRRATLRPDWEEVKVDVMRDLLIQKFGSSRALQNWLVETDDAFLVEGNTWGDKTWGAVWNGKEWEGENLLGYLLMEVRALAREDVI